MSPFSKRWATSLLKVADSTTVLIRTAKGAMIDLRYDTASARPHPSTTYYSLQGVRASYESRTESIWIEGWSKGYRWEPLGNYGREFEHPLWVKWRKQAEGSGHSGGDFFVIREFLEAVRRGGPSPIDAYDAAAWSSIIPLSAKSIAEGGAPQEIPDFTRGKWKTRKAWFRPANRPQFHLPGLRTPRSLGRSLPPGSRGTTLCHPIPVSDCRRRGTCPYRHIARPTQRATRDYLQAPLDQESGTPGDRWQEPSIGLLACQAKPHRRWPSNVLKPREWASRALRDPRLNETPCWLRLRQGDGQRLPWRPGLGG